MPSATIKLFLVHGDAKRLRTAELSNWTGKAIAGPRSEFEGVLSREEAANSGVYFLTGSEPEIGKNAVYVGEAESIRDRLRNHLDKDFWNHVIFFISKDENLTKAHIRYLEGRLMRTSEGHGTVSRDEWPIQRGETARVGPRRYGNFPEPDSSTLTGAWSRLSPPNRLNCFWKNGT